MITIGVTGGIGSGKSLVCSLFSQEGIPVFYADDVAKELPEKDFSLLQRIGKEFGPDTIDTKAKKLNPKVLAAKVFPEHKKVQKLNAILHPLVFREFDIWKSNHSSSQYVLLEAALLYESGMNAMTDYVLLVHAEEHLRIKRIQTRNGLSVEQIRARMNNQSDPDVVMKKADFVVQNNGTEEDLSHKIKFFHLLFSNLTTSVTNSK